MNKVDVLLATFQGAQYLEQQLDSILTQTYPYFHLWIRDDGSSDSTLLILQKWAQIYPHKITLLPFSRRLGIKGNFSELIKHSQAPYLMLADQDDQWLPHKIEWSVKHVKVMEEQYGTSVPLLVHTDLKVVNQDLAIIAPSFWHYTRLNPAQTSLNRLFVQNIITGCTILMNRPLARLAYPIPADAIMHDWWIGLIASCFGHIEFVEQATLLYRQHYTNDTGAKRYSISHFIKQCLKQSQKKCVDLTYQQAYCFLENFKPSIPLNQQQIIKAYLKLEHLYYFKKTYQIINYQFFKHGFLRNIRYFLIK